MKCPHCDGLLEPIQRRNEDWTWSDFLKCFICKREYLEKEFKKSKETEGMALTEERKQEIKKLILAGKNNSDINRAMNCHPTNTTPSKVRKEMVASGELNGILKETNGSIPDPPARKKKVDSLNSSSNDITFLARKLAILHENDEGESGMNARYLLLLLKSE